MAVIKAVSSRATLKRAIDYISQESKTNPELMNGIGCSPDTALDEMEAVKKVWDKEDGRTYKHFSLSYHKDENITPEQILKNATKLAEDTPAFKGHQILVVVHTDKDEGHAHIIVNSVNAEDGHKLQWSKADLKDLKQRSDELCREQGLTVTQKGKTFEGADREETSAYTKDAYNLLKKAERGEVKSYVQDIALNVMECRDKATSRQEFIDLLKERGIRTDWTDKRKHVTFTDTAREERGEAKCKVRNTKLSEYYNIDFGKEELERGFEDNLRTVKEAGRKLDSLDRATDADDHNDGSGSEGEGRRDSDAEIREAEAKAKSAAAERANREAEQQRLRALQEQTALRGREKGKGRSLSKTKNSPGIDR